MSIDAIYALSALLGAGVGLVGFWHRAQSKRLSVVTELVVGAELGAGTGLLLGFVVALAVGAN